MITIRLTDVIIAIMALYGAVIATITLVRQIRQGKVRVKVKASLGFMMTTINPSGEEIYTFTASNHGFRTITLSNFGLLAPDINKYIFIPIPPVDIPSPEFPYELMPGSCCDFHVKVDDLKKGLEGIAEKSIKLIPYFMDALGKKHKGKAITLQLEE